MELFMTLLKAFLVGGALCMIGEILLLKTKLTPARILVGYIVAGVFLSAIGVYAPLAQFAGAGIQDFHFSVQGLAGERLSLPGDRNALACRRSASG